MRKCFDNLVRLDFGDDPSSVDIQAMFSGEGERVALGKNLKARGNVEDWLSSVEARMKLSLHGLMKAGLLDYENSVRDEWVVGGTAGQVRSRRFEVLRCLHFVDVTRGHQTRSWLVSFLILRPHRSSRRWRR